MQNSFRKATGMKSAKDGFMNKTVNFDLGVITPKRKKMNKTPNFSMSVTKNAFTLVEILIVVAVIGILFVALVPKIDFAGDKAREAGVKTDFRALSLAAEQLLRENAGISKHDTLAKLCAADGGINLYLDNALQFSAAGTSAKLDAWNQAYTVQVLTPASGNINNGGIIFLCNGKDSLLSSESDNYAIAIVYIDGVIETATSGFSSNIKTGSITTIEADAASGSMSVSSGAATLKYKK